MSLGVIKKFLYQRSDQLTLKTTRGFLFLKVTHFVSLYVVVESPVSILVSANA